MTSATSLLRPHNLVVENAGERRARVVLEPLERGFGHTLGNALRRVLLSSIPGAAITEVEIDGVVDLDLGAAAQPVLDRILDGDDVGVGPRSPALVQAGVEGRALARPGRAADDDGAVGAGQRGAQEAESPRLEEDGVERPGHGRGLEQAHDHLLAAQGRDGRHPQIDVAAADPPFASMVPTYARLEHDPSWSYRTIGTGHDMMVTAPADLASLLLEA